MKVERIRITIEKPKSQTQAYILRYDISRDSRDTYIYSLRNFNNPVQPDPDYYYYGSGSTINIQFVCPKCATEYDLKTKRWGTNEKLNVVCVCGEHLNILPEHNRYV